MVYKAMKIINEEIMECANNSDHFIHLKHANWHIDEMQIEEIEDALKKAKCRKATGSDGYKH